MDSSQPISYLTYPFLLYWSLRRTFLSVHCRCMPLIKTNCAYTISKPTSPKQLLVDASRDYNLKRRVGSIYSWYLRHGCHDIGASGNLFNYGWLSLEPCSALSVSLPIFRLLFTYLDFFPFSTSNPIPFSISVCPYVINCFGINPTIIHQLRPIATTICP